MALSRKTRLYGSALKTAGSVFAGLSLFAALAMILFVAGRYDPLDNSQLQTIVVDRDGEALPRVPLSFTFVPVLGTKCVKGDDPVEIKGTGPNWIVLEPVGGVLVMGSSGIATLEPDHPDRLDGCITREFENPIPDDVIAVVERHGQARVRIFGEEDATDPLRINPFDWSPETGLPGFFPVSADWRTEDFIIYDDTEAA